MTERDVSTEIKSELCEHDQEAVSVFHRIGRKDKGTLNTLLIHSFDMRCKHSYFRTNIAYCCDIWLYSQYKVLRIN